jgi:hypothetical protein
MPVQPGCDVIVFKCTNSMIWEIWRNALRDSSQRSSYQGREVQSLEHPNRIPQAATQSVIGHVRQKCTPSHMLQMHFRSTRLSNLFGTRRPTPLHRTRRRRADHEPRTMWPLAGHTFQWPNWTTSQPRSAFIIMFCIDLWGFSIDLPYFCYNSSKQKNSVLHILTFQKPSGTQIDQDFLQR